MATTDYDAPRATITDEDSLDELKARRNTPVSGSVDVDEGEAETFELPGAEQLDEELSVTVVPMQADEFRCSKCFLVWHRHQVAAGETDICRDCA